MSVWQAISVIALGCGGLAAIFIIYCRSTDAFIRGLMHELRALRVDNKALIEALARKSNTPLIFPRVDPIPSKGWWDRQPEPVARTLTVTKEE